MWATLVRANRATTKRPTPLRSEPLSVQCGWLFPVEVFVDCYFAVLLYGDDAMDTLES
jgi:hypothetical protein